MEGAWLADRCALAKSLLNNNDKHFGTARGTLEIIQAKPTLHQLEFSSSEKSLGQSKVTKQVTDRARFRIYSLRAPGWLSQKGKQLFDLSSSPMLSREITYKIN